MSTTGRRVSELNLPRQAWKPIEVAAMLGLPYESVLDLINAGVIGHVPAGRQKLIPAKELDRYLSDIKHGDPAA